MSKADTIQFASTKAGSLALHEWRKTEGDAATMAAARGTLSAAVAMMVTIEGEKKTFEYLQDIADEVIKPVLPR